MRAGKVHNSIGATCVIKNSYVHILLVDFFDDKYGLVYCGVSLHLSVESMRKKMS